MTKNEAIQRVYRLERALNNLQVINENAEQRGFLRGYKLTATQCAEIADEFASCEGIAQKIAAKIRKEFSV